MESLMEKIRNITKKLIIIFLSFFLFVIIVGAFRYKSVFSYKIYGDLAVLLDQQIQFLILGLIVCFLAYLVFWKLTARLELSWVSKICLLLLSVYLQISAILLFQIKLTADWEVVYGISQKLSMGDLTSIQKGGYLFAYPNNLGLTIYFVIVNFITNNNIFIIRLLNVLWAVLTTILLNKLYKEFYPSKSEAEKSRFYIFTVFFIPALFMSNLVYNEVLSTMLFLGAVYETSKFVETKRNIDLMGAIIFLSFANFIRGIGLLFLISILTYLFIFKINWKYLLAFSVFTFVGFSLPLQIVNLAYFKTGRIAEPIGKNSVPISKWIHLGLNETYFGYWDQGESYSIYANDADWKKEKANSIFVENIKDKLNSYGIQGTLGIYFKKLVWLWTEGTYQSVYLGMSHSSPGGYVAETPISRTFDEHENYREIFKTPMYFANLASLVIIFLFLAIEIYRGRWRVFDKEIILILIILSFILFYLIWEVKPRYIYPVYPYLLLMGFVCGRRLLEGNKHFK